MQTGQDRSSLMSDINVTPMVDVMLVLLIIFMVTAPMMMQGMKVDLPQTSSEPMAAEEDNLVISVMKDGAIYLNDYKVEPATLAGKLARIREARPDQRVFLQADRTVPYGVVVRVMADVKEAGINHLGVVTQPEKNDGESGGNR